MLAVLGVLSAAIAIAAGLRAAIAIVGGQDRQIVVGCGVVIMLSAALFFAASLLAAR